MNEKLTALLEQLAIKLGTTAQHLWRVLIIQAKVSAACNMAFIVFVYIFAAVLLNYHVKFIKKIPGNRHEYNTYEDNEAVGVIMIIAIIVWAILFITHFFSWASMINGFFNPEYWALQEVLSVIK